MTDAAAPDAAQRSARRLRLLTIFALLIVAGIELTASTQNWWTVHLVSEDIQVQGTAAAGALSALALTGIALAAALAIAGPVFRAILAVLQLLLAFTVVLTSAMSVSAPARASESLVSKATGIAGDRSLDALVKSVTYTPWGWVAIVAGILGFLIGVFLLITFRRWPVASRKYQAVRFQDPDGPRDAVVDWDSLSDGKDPTE
jgi:MFS family permease